MTLPTVHTFLVLLPVSSVLPKDWVSSYLYASLPTFFSPRIDNYSTETKIREKNNVVNNVCK
jgi:hypothetical protein